MCTEVNWKFLRMLFVFTEPCALLKWETCSATRLSQKSKGERAALWVWLQPDTEQCALQRLGPLALEAYVKKLLEDSKQGGGCNQSMASMDWGRSKEQASEWKTLFDFNPANPFPDD